MRACFTLQIRHDKINEYKESHKNVWPEMLTALRKAGWNNYSLFLSNEGLLVGYVETKDFTSALDNMAKSEINLKWQSEMAPYFDNMDGVRADKGLTILEEVFHLA